MECISYKLKKMKSLKKHKAIIVRILAAGILSGLAAACIKDTGNYDYNDVNRIEISGIKNVRDIYMVSLGRPLRITPTLTFSVSEDKDSLQYRWHVLGGSFYNSTGVLSTERDLDVIIGGSLIPRVGIYQLMYCVTNMTTGIRYDHRFRIDVQDEMQTGFIMLCERENDGFDIDLISMFKDTMTQYHNLLDRFESQLPREGRKPLDMLCYGDGASPKLGADGMKKFAIWILTDKGTDRVRVEDFEWQPEFNISGISVISEKYLQGKKLIAEKMVSSAPPVNVSGYNWAYFEGNWYWYNWPMMAYFYLQPVNAETSVSAPYKAAPYMCGNSTYTAVLFNEDANRFEWQNAAPMQPTVATMCTQRFYSAGSFFNWENPNYSLIYMDNRVAETGYAVVKDVSTEKYELLLINVHTTMSAPVQLGRYLFPDGFPAETIQFFALSYSLPYLYCATEDKIYRMNISSMAATQQWDDVTASVLPAGHRFSKVKSTAIRFPRNMQLAVCTYDPNGQPGQNGQLAFYDIQDGTGNLTLAKHPATPTEAGYQIDMKWTGFGKIINVDYKQP